MKKIITALTVTAMALSAVFADVSLEFKQMGHLLADSPDNSTGTLDLFTGYANTSAGNLKFAVKNSNAGVEFTIKPTLNNSGNTVAWNNYFGWTKFADGKAELRAGRWESRTVNRYNEYAGDYEGTYYERYKPGSIGGNTADLNRLTGKALAAQVQYKLDGGAWVTGALIKSTYDNTSGINSQSGWAAEFGTDVGEGTKIIVDFKNLAQDQYAFGVFGRNTTLKDGLDFQAGFVFDRMAATANNFLWAVDFRAKYELGDNLALITMNNLTNDATAALNGKPAIFKIWNMVSLAVLASDNATINLTAHWEHDDLLNNKDISHNTQGRVTLSPMVNYLVGKGVNISGGVNIDITGWGQPDTALFSIPFVVHVKI